MLHLQSVKYPKKSYIYVQDVLGKKFNNPLVQLYKQRCVETQFMSDQTVISPDLLDSLSCRQAVRIKKTVFKRNCRECVIV